LFKSRRLDPDLIPSVSSRPRRILALLATLAIAAIGTSGAQAAGPVYSPEPPHTPAPIYVVAPPGEKSAPDQVSTPSRPRIATRPKRRTHKHLARFVFVGGTSFECQVDHAPYRQCGAVFTRFVSDGRHVLRVRDAGGGPVASFHWRVLPKHH
jgi:hypothetical protein